MTPHLYGRTAWCPPVVGIRGLRQRKETTVGLLSGFVKYSLFKRLFNAFSNRNQTTRTRRRY